MVKDKSFKMRISRDEKKLYEGEAGKLGLTLAGFVRMCIMREINLNNGGKSNEEIYRKI